MVMTVCTVRNEADGLDPIISHDIGDGWSWSGRPAKLSWLRSWLLQRNSWRAVRGSVLQRAFAALCGDPSSIFLLLLLLLLLLLHLVGQGRVFRTRPKGKRELASQSSNLWNQKASSFPLWSRDWCRVSDAPQKPLLVTMALTLVQGPRSRSINAETPPLFFTLSMMARVCSGGALPRLFPCFGSFDAVWGKNRLTIDVGVYGRVIVLMWGSNRVCRNQV